MKLVDLIKANRCKNEENLPRKLLNGIDFRIPFGNTWFNSSEHRRIDP
jgi:hypothetical protein